MTDRIIRAGFWTHCVTEDERCMATCEQYLNSSTIDVEGDEAFCGYCGTLLAISKDKLFEPENTAGCPIG